MFLHLSPPELQRCQRKLKLIGVEPDHTPGVAVSVAPTVGTPVKPGGVVFAGAVRCAPSPPPRRRAAPVRSAARLTMDGVFPPDRIPAASKQNAYRALQPG